MQYYVCVYVSLNDNCRLWIKQFLYNMTHIVICVKHVLHTSTLSPHRMHLFIMVTYFVLQLCVGHTVGTEEHVLHPTHADVHRRQVGHTVLRVSCCIFVTKKRPKIFHEHTVFVDLFNSWFSHRTD